MTLKKKWVVLSALVVVAVAFVFFWVRGNFGNEARLRSILQSSPENVIAVVGREKIYVSDLSSELPYHRGRPVYEDLVQKLIYDSVVLQAGEDEGLVELEEEFFDNPEKDYTERLRTVDTIKSMVRTRGGMIAGSVLSLRFRSDTYTDPRGVDKSKQVAFDTMVNLHQQLSSGAITMEEAEFLLKENTSLASLDPDWKARALFTYEARSGDPVTLDHEFDRMLWELPEGGLTGVFLARDPVSDEQLPEESIYYIGFVGTKDQENTTDIQEWILNKSDLYPAIVY